ncbi:MAG: class I SAM-dependent methyltransferase [Actinobacteria bacterium]|nr:class I SAM-dependent methyltransferase [Actinomycetota bacterium]
MPKIEPFEKHALKYEEWFIKNEYAYQSELNAIKDFMPDFDTAVEIGVGSGKFAVPLKIKSGVDPSDKMKKIAISKGINVFEGIAEELPLADESFDLALMVTTLCFLDDAEKAFSEVHRILKPGGFFINGFVDKNSDTGKIYQKYKEKSLFYKIAVFYSTEEVISLLKLTGFKNFQFRQTIFKPLDKINDVEPVKEGYGEGSFIAIKAQK